MLIPFIMLLIVTIALILERKFQEDKINEIYEVKFENWKKHQKYDAAPPSKELVGLIYLKEYKLEIDILDDRATDPLTRKQYSIKNKLEVQNEITTNPNT